MQAAIGAVPLAAGVASGEVILAVAVLSILLTAPIGAIGIMVLGERVLDHGERSSYRFKELRDKAGLPRVRERVHDKQTGTIWKVIEEKEVWVGEKQGADSNHLVPAIEFRFWREDSSMGPGKGKTMYRRYSPKDEAFQNRWEILYDW